jgi:hypothetical protein
MATRVLLFALTFVLIALAASDFTIFSGWGASGTFHNQGIDPHELVRNSSDRAVPILPGTARTMRELA